MPYIVKTYGEGEFLTPSGMNTNVRDNFQALKAPPTDVVNGASAFNLDLTSTSWADVSATLFSATITAMNASLASALFVIATFSVRCSADATPRSIAFDLTLNGTSVSGGGGILIARGNVDQISPVSLFYHIPTVTGGTYTARLRYKVESGTSRIFMQSGGINNMIPQFALREMS